MNRIFGTIYFRITIAYVILIIFIPIVIIFVSNAFVIVKTLKAQSKKKNFKIECKLKRKSKHSKPVQVSIKIDIKKPRVTSALIAKKEKPKANEKITSQEKTEYQTTKALRKTNVNNSKKITKMLVVISFSYALLNLP